MALCEVYGDGQITGGAELTGLYAPTPALSFLTVQVPRTTALEPWS
jgi:hypothetical protein